MQKMYFKYKVIAVCKLHWKKMSDHHVSQIPQPLSLIFINISICKKNVKPYLNK